MRLTSRLITLAGIATLAAPLSLAAVAAPAGAAAGAHPAASTQRAASTPRAPSVRPAASTPSEWPQFGHSPRHLNTNPAEKTFTRSNVKRLRTIFTADFAGGPAGSTAAPAVTRNTVYTTSGTLFGNGVNTNFHLRAFPAAGCGAKTCKPLRTYDTGDGGAEGAPAVSGTMVFATTQASPDPNSLGVVAAYPAAGCGKPQCEPLWTGINFESGFASPPSVVNGVVFVGKGPATTVPVDAGAFAL